MTRSISTTITMPWQTSAPMSEVWSSTCQASGKGSFTGGKVRDRWPRTETWGKLAQAWPLLRQAQISCMTTGWPPTRSSLRLTITAMPARRSFWVKETSQSGSWICDCRRTHRSGWVRLNRRSVKTNWQELQAMMRKTSSTIDNHCPQVEESADLQTKSTTCARLPSSFSKPKSKQIGLI